MASTKSLSLRGATIRGRTWFCAGTILVVIGMVAIAAELLLQQQLHRSKCDESIGSIFPSLNVKAGIWCGIPIVVYGLSMISVGLFRTKAMMIMVAFLIGLFIFPALLLLIAEVNIASSYNYNTSFARGRTEANREPQLLAVPHDEPVLRFSPSDEIRPTHGGHRRFGIKAERMNQDLNPPISGETALELEAVPVSPADVARNTADAALVSEMGEADDASYEWSGVGEGLGDDEDELSGERQENDVYENDVYENDSGLEENRVNRTAEEEEENMAILTDCYEDRRKRRDVSQNCLEEEEITLQWLFQLMSCLMALVGSVVLILSTVMATLFCSHRCYDQEDKMTNSQKTSEMQSSTSAAVAAEKDNSGMYLWSKDVALLEP